jgi:hypothetical protein
LQVDIYGPRRNSRRGLFFQLLGVRGSPISFAETVASAS